LRSRAEQATAEITGDAQAKLLRQIETLQTQYSLAAENWRTIETSLNSRIAATEKERDEYVKRESDVRRKAKDVGTKSKRLEEELEKVIEEQQSLSQQLLSQQTEMKTLQSRCKAAEDALEEAKADFERQRQSLETEITQRLEDERVRAQQALELDADVPGATASRTQSPLSYFRKPVAHESLNPAASRRNLQRVSSNDQPHQLSSRRPSALGTPGVSGSRASMTPDLPSPGVSRQNSAFSLSQLNAFSSGIPPTPSIHTTDADPSDHFDTPSSPRRAAADMVSASTVHTGPSVQLVERMSSSIRRLESEKAAHKDELARLQAQRDESRDEVVALLREAESKRRADERATALEAELVALRKRHEACLEILGEREEEVEELRGDVVELKKIYRDLAERSMR